ncbi:conjugative transfer signal peptidase TraF [Erwinia pyrifoliae]|uniref:conjugative transfer signal peptidase TraF n=1 Tax=Erwinia pyrifoliae TaxID=79967 RepID=UPI00223A76D8|nr:conjugative transfer signal peptidase TraF [Erwinia pyrifoliae]MCT2388876.1 conjugative transfer signal peptidase TraF [Erwinia pyrifoliae]MCU8589070.1 conjugative transfer signal peptidase TraF [Erwinia pyrifoliae]
MNRRTGTKFAVATAITMLIITASTAALYFGGYRFNHTTSLPMGVYRLNGESISRGKIVVFCPDTRKVFAMATDRLFIAKGNCPNGTEPLFKPIAAMSGDKVNISSAGLSVNGVLLYNTVAKKKDGMGRPMPVIPDGEYVVKPGEVWLASTYNPQSFDSRYFGAVALKDVRGVMNPIWVEK